ncbi:MAG: hypothetical protein WBA74_04160 [Cyclobacteriaceae bacterium]
MFLKNLKKYEIDKKLLSDINGGGYGSVVCNNGDQFDAPAESENSVTQGGKKYCEHRGGVNFTLYIGDVQ